MIPSSTTRKQGKGAAAPFPCTPNPRRTPRFASDTPFGPSHLTIPNTCCTIIMSASLRSDRCSPSPRNAVRLASGIDVHLHRNTRERLNSPGRQFFRKEETLNTRK